MNTYPTEAANSDIDRCMKEDSMYEAARLLADIAIKARMEMHGVDREEACWLATGFEVHQK